MILRTPAFGNARESPLDLRYKQEDVHEVVQIIIGLLFFFSSDMHHYFYKLHSLTFLFHLCLGQAFNLLIIGSYSYLNAVDLLVIK